MDLADKMALLDRSLERAAERLGDVTVPAMERYFTRYPDSLAAFELLRPGASARLAGEMVERTLYCVMQWLECPGEIEIMLLGSVPHHARTLEIRSEWFAGFIEAVVETIVATIPDACPDEHAVWRELRQDLLQLVETSALYA
jgi:hypothetical protein